MVDRHFPLDLSLNSFPSRNGRHSNITLPPLRTSRNESLDIFSALSKCMRFLAVETGHSHHSPASAGVGSTSYRTKLPG